MKIEAGNKKTASFLSVIYLVFKNKKHYYFAILRGGSNGDSLYY